MQPEKSALVTRDSILLPSDALEREVQVDFYLSHFPEAGSPLPQLLLVNDGQDLVTMEFDKILSSVYSRHNLSPLLVVGIHCGPDRKNEYGMLESADFKGRGAKALEYREFIFVELLPFISRHFPFPRFAASGFAGFSLGGLSALDLAWNHPETFSRAAVFSGSLWWRSRDKSDKHYDDANDRLMLRQIRFGAYRPGMQFFFQCGELDEMEDRNHNGVIDSIDDTLDVMRELLRKGYREGKDMVYLQLPDGRHDVPTWARSFPSFLKWAYSIGSK